MEKVTVVLCSIDLEVITEKNGRKRLLGVEDATDRDGRAAARPDILHQCMLTLLDSPLNKSGNLRVLVQTARGVVIDVNPCTRIPRTFNRFSGLILQLLEKKKIKPEHAGSRSRGPGSAPPALLQCVKGPVDRHFPLASLRVGLSQQGEVLPSPIQSVISDCQTKSLSPVFFINAVASGADAFGEADRVVSLSSFALSAATCCSKVCTGAENALGIF